MHHAPPNYTTKLSSVSLVPAVSSLHATAGTSMPVTLNVSQPVLSLSQVTIDLTKEEDHDNALDHSSSTPNYGMELHSNKELLKGEALEWSRTLSSIPKGAKCQGKP
jgi:hypothetical protein